MLTLSRLAKILFCLAIKYLDQSKLAVLKQLTGQDKTAEGKKGFLHARRQTIQPKYLPRACAKKQLAVPHNKIENDFKRNLSLLVVMLVLKSRDANCSKHVITGKNGEKVWHNAFSPFLCGEMLSA